MGYDIIYDVQFIRTGRGVTPVVLCGPNNVTTGTGKHERRVRSWSIWSSDMLDIPEADLLHMIEECMVKYDPKDQLFKRGGKWVTPVETVRMFRTACRKAARIEDIHSADRGGFLSCSVKHYKDNSLRIGVYQSVGIIKTTKDFEDWVDAARPVYEDLKKQGLNPWFSVQFNSGEKPLKKCTKVNGQVAVKTRWGAYVKDYTNNSVSYTSDPNKAMIFDNAAAAQSVINRVFLENMRIVSADSVERKRDMTTVLMLDSGCYAGCYIHQLTRRSLKYTRNAKWAKKFKTEKSALAWFQNYRIAERFSNCKTVRAVNVNDD